MVSDYDFPYNLPCSPGPFCGNASCFPAKLKFILRLIHLCLAGRDRQESLDCKAFATLHQQSRVTRLVTRSVLVLVSFQFSGQTYNRQISQLASLWIRVLFPATCVGGCPSRLERRIASVLTSCQSDYISGGNFTNSKQVFFI